MTGQKSDSTNLQKYMNLILKRKDQEAAKRSLIFIPSKLKKNCKIESQFFPYIFRFLVKDIKGFSIE